MSVDQINQYRRSGTLNDLKNSIRDSLDLSRYKSGKKTWQKKIIVDRFMHAYDCDFYDLKKQKIRVKEIAEEGKKNFGGYDIILLWPTYPRLGIDESCSSRIRYG